MKYREKNIGAKAYIASGILAIELAEVFKKYGLDVFVTSAGVDVCNYGNFDTDFQINTTLNVHFSFKDFQKCNPQLQALTLGSDQTLSEPDHSSGKVQSDLQQGESQP